MKRDHYEPGNILCDMHDRFEFLPDNLEVVRDITVRTDHASETVVALNGGKHPGNKYLVVTGRDRFGTGLVAAYSYDGRYFGLVELKYKAAAPAQEQGE